MFKTIMSKNTGLTCVEISHPSQEVYNKIIKIFHSQDISNEEINTINQGIASFFQSKKEGGYDWILIAFWSEDIAKAFLDLISKEINLSVDVDNSKLYSLSYNQVRTISKELSSIFGVDESRMDYELLKALTCINKDNDSAIKMIQESRTSKTFNKCLFCNNKCDKNKCP